MNWHETYLPLPSALLACGIALLLGLIIGRFVQHREYTRWRRAVEARGHLMAATKKRA